MNLLSVLKQYPEIKEVILNRIDTIYEKAQLVEARNIADDDIDNNSILVDDYLKKFLLKYKDISRDITQILDNFEELMDSLLSKSGGIYIDIIGSIILQGGLLDDFKNRINSYKNISIYYSDKEPYRKLFESSKSLCDFEVIALLNKKYKENGKFIELEQRDLPSLYCFSSKELNTIVDNWDEEYKELFEQIDRIQGRVNSDYPSLVFENDEEYRKKLNYFFYEYVNLDKKQKRHLLDYLKYGVFNKLEDDSIINTPEKIRNIDKSIFDSIIENPDLFKCFFKNICRKKFDEKYFDKIQDNDSLNVINLYDTFYQYINNGNYNNAQKLLEDNNISIFDLIDKFNGLNSKYSEHCHKTISESLTDYQKMEKEGQITTRVENGCKIYELKGQPFFGILHTANANLDNFYFYEAYTSENGEYLDDEDMKSNIQLDENMLYHSSDKESRSCSIIGNDYLGYVKGSKNRNVIHFGITKIDYSNILISSNNDLDLKPGETIMQISDRNMQYPASEILSQTESKYNETLIKSFNEDGTPIKLDIIYSFHTDGPTQEEIDTAKRFGIDIVWVDVKTYDRQRRKQLALELNSEISNEVAQKRYYNYINGRGYELGEELEIPTIEDIRQDKEIAIEILHDIKEKRDAAKTFNSNVRQIEENMLRGNSSEEK